MIESTMGRLLDLSRRMDSCPEMAGEPMPIADSEVSAVADSLAKLQWREHIQRSEIETMLRNGMARVFNRKIVVL